MFPTHFHSHFHYYYVLYSEIRCTLNLWLVSLQICDCQLILYNSRHRYCSDFEVLKLVGGSKVAELGVSVSAVHMDSIRRLNTLVDALFSTVHHHRDNLQIYLPHHMPSFLVTIYT